VNNAVQWNSLGCTHCMF